MYSNFEHDVLKLQFRASVRTFNPKQLKYEDKSDIKFKHSVFMRNVNRVKAATADMAEPEVIIRELQAILNGTEVRAKAKSESGAAQKRTLGWPRSRPLGRDW